MIEILQRKEKYKLVSLLNRKGKKFKPNISIANIIIYKRIVHIYQIGFIPGVQDLFNIKNQIVTYLFIKIKYKTHMIISVDAEELEKILHQFMFKKKVLAK